MNAKAAAIASSRTAKAITIAMLAFQLGGCVVDFVSGQQAVLWTYVCLLSDNLILGAGGWLIWAVVSFSWILGLAALKWAQLRPAYWALILLSPFVYLGHKELLDRRVFSCDVF